MKQSSYKGKSPLPDFVIDAACAGNAEAVERVLQHYDGYINKLCTRGRSMTAAVSLISALTSI